MHNIFIIRIVSTANLSQLTETYRKFRKTQLIGILSFKLELIKILCSFLHKLNIYILECILISKSLLSKYSDSVAAHRLFTIHLLRISVCVPAFVLSESSAHLFDLAQLKTPLTSFKRYLKFPSCLSRSRVHCPLQWGREGKEWQVSSRHVSGKSIEDLC